MDDSHPPVLQYLNPRTRYGLRSGFRQFPPVDRLVALAAVLLLPCAAMADADDEMEVWIVTVTAAALALIVLARWAVAILLAARPARATHPQMRKWRRAASVLVLAVWMVLIQGASCPHADYLRVGPWYFWWG
ncbi:MAG: hypothetical protein QOE14_1329, partial [Humisphaera sp.]|nr:hypothetical protein [Humisphaera sp.]